MDRLQIKIFWDDRIPESAEKWETLSDINVPSAEKNMIMLSKDMSARAAGVT